MKHPLTLLLLGLGAVALAADTFTFTGIKLVTYFGNDSNVTVYDTHQSASNGWMKEIVNSWAIVTLGCELPKRYRDEGNHQRVQYGVPSAHLTVTTTRTPANTFTVSFLNDRTATAVALVDMNGANAYALGSIGTGRDGFETRPPASQYGPGTDDRSVVAAQTKIFLRWENAPWQLNNGIYSRQLLVPMSRLYGKSVVSIPPGSSSNMAAANAASGGRDKLKASTLTFGATAGRNRWVNGTYNGTAANPWLTCEVRNINNAFLDTARSVNSDSNSFGFDFGQMAIPASSSSTTYKVTFRRKGALNKMMLLTLDPQVGLDGVFVDFKYGDVNQDNEVTADEVGLILTHIGAQFPNWDYMENIPGFEDLMIADLDVDGDGTVTLNDYLISLPNIGLVGD